MIVIFGKGKVGNAMVDLLNFLGREYLVMDDQDRDDVQLEQAETIMVTPGLPQHHKLYQNYKQKCMGELDLLAELRETFFGTDKQFPDLETIGITGTNGKSTTSWIVYNLFRNLFAQQNISTPVFISGNFGTPLSAVLLELLQKNSRQALVILEVSSFMLYACKKFTFDYSILTNIATDHLDWHKDFDEYQHCKQHIITQTIHHAYTIASVYTTLEKKLQNKTAIFDDDFDLKHTQFLGKHNQYNFKSADMLVRQYHSDHQLDFSEKDYQKALAMITPLDHRMKLIKTVKNRKKLDENQNLDVEKKLEEKNMYEINIYDDGICTSAHALIGALSCFDDVSSCHSCEDRNLSKIVLIAGGYDKGEDYTHLGPLLKENVAFLSLLGATGKTKFLSIAEQENIEYRYSETLEQAVNTALAYAKDHSLSVVLFSPGSASFDMFKNVYDRCEQFEKIVEKL